MKNILKILEENSKWLVRVLVSILVGVGVVLILRLFYFGVDSHCSGFCIVDTIDYYWTNASSIAFLLITAVGFLILFIGESKKGVTKIKLAVIILVLGLLGKPLFYLISPDFKFYDIGEYKYTDKNGKLTNIDLYLEGMKKYCDNSIDDFKFKRVYREDMCAGQYVIDLNTVEEYAKVFDYANKNNLRRLYKLTYNGAQDFGIEKIIEGYKDDTFYAFLIYKGDLTMKQIELLGNNIEKNNLLQILKFYNESILENQKLMKIDKNYDLREYWKNNDKLLFEKLKKLLEVNTDIF